MYCHFQKFIDSAQPLCIDGTLNSYPLDTALAKHGHVTT
ncbi:hypothetical protein ACFMJS_22345, partial [Acinetobacter baumannii]